MFNDYIFINKFQQRVRSQKSLEGTRSGVKMLVEFWQNFRAIWKLEPTDHAPWVLCKILGYKTSYVMLNRPQVTKRRTVYTNLQKFSKVLSKALSNSNFKFKRNLLSHKTAYSTYKYNVWYSTISKVKHLQRHIFFTVSIS